MRRTTLWIGLVAVLLASCQAGVVSTTDASPPAAPQTTAAQTTGPQTTGPQTTGPPSTVPPIELGDCDQPPEGWAPFCDAFELIQERYVDPADDALLADAASRGLVDFGPGDQIGSPSTLSCVLPSDSFQSFCAALAETDGAGKVPASEWAVAGIQGMVAFGLDDPHSFYLSPEALERQQEDDAGEVEGIGALVSAEDRNGEGCALISDECRLRIVGVIEGSPADQAGLRNGDVIVGVDGESTVGMAIDTIVSLVRGPAGTDVTLAIGRGEDVFEVSIERAAVLIPIVESELLSPDLAYIQLALFTDDSPERVRKALQDLFDQGARDVILDLQDNPGGTLDAAVRIASEFLADGLVLRTEGPEDSSEYVVRPGGIATAHDVRVVVLINEASASASEVVAAALQESGRATVIGEFSFGKNTVQQQFSLVNGGALKLTIARWVTPEGVDYGETGVTPDVLVDLQPGDNEDRLLEAARTYLTGT